MTLESGACLSPAPDLRLQHATCQLPPYSRCSSPPSSSVCRSSSSSSSPCDDRSEPCWGARAGVCAHSFIDQARARTQHARPHTQPYPHAQHGGLNTHRTRARAYTARHNQADRHTHDTQTRRRNKPAQRHRGARDPIQPKSAAASRSTTVDLPSLRHQWAALRLHWPARGLGIELPRHPPRPPALRFLRVWLKGGVKGVCVRARVCVRCSGRCACVRVCAYACGCMSCEHACARERGHACRQMQLTRMHAFIMHSCIHARMHTRMHSCIHARMHAFVHTCIHRWACE